MARLRVKVLAKYTSVVAVVYFLVAIIVTMSGNDDTATPMKLVGDMMLAKTHSPHLQTLYSPKATLSKNICEEIHIAIVVPGTHTTLQYVQMLKTIFHFRNNPIVLHIVSDNPTKHIMSTLLQSWGIPGLHTYFYTTNMASALKSERGELEIKFKLNQLLPLSIAKVIVLDSHMRFASDILTLWKEFDKFSNNTVIEVHRSIANNKPQYLLGVMLIDLRKWRTYLERNAVPHVMTSSWENVNSWFETHQSMLRQLPCTWQLRLQQKINIQECLGNNQPLAFWWPEKSAPYSGHAEVEQIKLVVQSVVETDGELLRHSASPCFRVPYESFNLSTSCSEFRYATRIKRRTHLYIYGNFQREISLASDPYDVTLVTQLTPDRFAILERMAKQWEGPLHAVFHVTEQEALQLPVFGRSSKIIAARKNIAFHAVYKRGVFYPINYMRNVGINQSATPYTLFIDVDLVPNNGLYKAIKTQIPKHMRQPKETLVVPAFEAFKYLPVFPDSKAALLKLMANRTVEGYRMSRGWNLGHKPTNYPKWEKATEPYVAEFKDAFEPYVVLPTKLQPQFQETLLERMGDKIAYGRILYAMGYQFKVLPDQFVIHLPHPVSKGTNMWKSYPGYGRCSGILFEEFRAETKRKYPWQKVH